MVGLPSAAGSGGVAASGWAALEKEEDREGNTEDQEVQRENSLRHQPSHQVPAEVC